MKQLELFRIVEEEVQPRQRLATSRVVNPAFCEVTSKAKPGETRCRAVTQVKVLSPESNNSGVEVVHSAEDRNRITDKRRGDKNLAGSEATARYEKDRGRNSGEPMCSQLECCNKPIDGKERQDIIHWQSDYSIVSKKPGNAGGEKGIAAMQRDARDTSAGHRTGEQMRTKLASLTKRAREKPRAKFVSLAHMLTVEFLRSSFWELKRDKALGIDGVSVREYEENLEENLKDLVSRLKARKYIPQATRRVYIPKRDGSKRGLGIPTVEDKIVQQGIKKILEAIYEVDFIEVSYGFRPNRSCHDALDKLNEEIMWKPTRYVVDVDIEKFFDTIDHDWLMRGLEVRIKDTSLLRIIKRFLKAGIMEEGRYKRTEKGTPQGGVISPILANIYLHYVLDLWFEKRVKQEAKAHIALVRYADDFVVTCQSGRDAKEFEAKLRERLSKFGLKVSEKKSRVIEFGRYAWAKAQAQGKKMETFDFLGFTHYCARTRKGNFKLGRKTAKDRQSRSLIEINEWLKRVRNAMELKEWWKILRMKVVGHYRYYGISGNSNGISDFYHWATKLVYKWINGRSQKKSYDWDKFNRYLKYNPLPKPRIYHATYALSS